MPAPLRRYERSGDIDMFRLGIIGEADDEMENYVEVGLASIDDDHPVGMVAVRGLLRRHLVAALAGYAAGLRRPKAGRRGKGPCSLALRLG